MPNVIWDKAGNPTPYVSKRLGVTQVDFRRALHKIKQANGLEGDDATVFYDDGTVECKASGDDIGNIHDED